MLNDPTVGGNRESVDLPHVGACHPVVPPHEVAKWRHGKVPLIRSSA